MSALVWLICATCLFAGAFLGTLAICLLSAGKCDKCIEDAILKTRAELAALEQAKKHIDLVM